MNNPSLITQINGVKLLLEKRGYYVTNGHAQTKFCKSATEAAIEGMLLGPVPSGQSADELAAYYNRNGYKGD